MKKRKASKIVRGNNAIDGAGVHLRRVLGLSTVHSFDPFLMLDGFDSYDPRDYVKGFPWHPHRGIETVTYLVSGSMEHGDSLGNKGLIESMGCQWMTAGSGIIHQEMPLPSERMLGLQLWVNLPQKDKMTEPAYHDIREKNILKVQEDNATVGILSGSYKGTKSAFGGEYIKVTYLDVDLAPDSVWTYNEAQNDQTLFIYLLDGTLAPDEKLEVFEEKGCAILFTLSGDGSGENEQIQVKARSEGARFVVLLAKPLHEPIEWGSPIVMNTEEELQLAFRELDKGTFIKHKDFNSSSLR